MLATLAQIPNGNFEEWQTIGNIESPKYWQTNNYYESSTPVDKEEDAIEGNYSMKISSTAFNIFGTLPGCAHVKFLPQQIYSYMTASVKIDSIEMGEIDIRIKQRTPNGLFEQIGGWESTTPTAGVSQIVFPIAQTQLDTLLIEIWAYNTQTIFGITGYSEAVIDNLNLTTISSSLDAHFANGIKCLISPNPAQNVVSVRLDQALIGGPCRLRLLDLQGRVWQEHEFQIFSEATLYVGGLEPGVYLLQWTGERMAITLKVVIY